MILKVPVPLALQKIFLYGKRLMLRAFLVACQQHFDSRGPLGCLAATCRNVSSTFGALPVLSSMLAGASHTASMCTAPSHILLL